MKMTTDMILLRPERPQTPMNKLPVIFTDGVDKKLIWIPDYKRKRVKRLLSK